MPAHKGKKKSIFCIRIVFVASEMEKKNNNDEVVEFWHIKEFTTDGDKVREFPKLTEETTTKSRRKMRKP